MAAVEHLLAAPGAELDLEHAVRPGRRRDPDVAGLAGRAPRPAIRAAGEADA